MKLTKKWLKTLLAIPLSLVTSLQAFADVDVSNLGITPPGENDVSVRALNYMFGLVGGSEQANILSTIMPTWGGTMMFVGTLIVSYIIVVGVLKTAHDGTALGERWNSMFIPFRASVGLALTAPVFAGYGAIQLIVVWAAIQGAGIANMLLDGAVDQLAKNGGFVVSPPPTLESYNVVQTLYLSLTCQAARNATLARDQSSNSATAAPKIEMVAYGELNKSLSRDLLSVATLGLADDAYGLRFGDQSGMLSKTECGGFEWTFLNKAATDLEASNHKGFGLASLGWTGTYYQDIITGQRQAIRDAAVYLMPYVVTQVSSDGAETLVPKTVLMEAVNRYNNVLVSNVSKVQAYVKSQGLTDFAADVKNDGWAMAGAYYTRIGHMNAAANDIVDATPSKIAQEMAVEDEFAMLQIERSRAHTAKLMEESIPGVKNQLDDLTGTGASALLHPFLNLQSGIIKAIQWVGDPITRMQNIGHIILDTYWVMKGVEFAAEVVGPTKFAGAASKALGGAGNATGGNKYLGALNKTLLGDSKIMDAFNTAAFYLLIAGIVMAFVLPLVPYFIMLMSVMSWLTSIFIAVIAAPLWAISHATPDGHEAFGSGANGYILLMSVVLRPALTILAMFGSMTILYGMDYVLNLGYMTAFAGAQVNSASGPIGTVTGILIYCILSLVITYGSFRLVQTIPNAILQWVGGRDDDSLGVEQHNDRVLAMVNRAGENSRKTPGLKKQASINMEGNKGAGQNGADGASSAGMDKQLKMGESNASAGKPSNPKPSV